MTRNLMLLSLYISATTLRWYLSFFAAQTWPKMRNKLFSMKPHNLANKGTTQPIVWMKQKCHFLPRTASSYFRDDLAHNSDINVLLLAVNSAPLTQTLTKEVRKVIQPSWERKHVLQGSQNSSLLSLLNSTFILVDSSNKMREKLDLSSTITLAPDLAWNLHL